MREVVEQILENTYDYEKGSLEFSVKELEIEAMPGEIKEGSFRIFSKEGKYTKGHVFCSDPRMNCLTGEFVGREEEIPFCFFAKQLEEGEVVTGAFHIVSNQGEYELPYVVTVVSAYCLSSMGPIQNLAQFANLAKHNWKEAVTLFYTPEFHRILQAGDRHVYAAYLGLAAREGSEQSVEEFLLAVGKKNPIEFLLPEREVFLDNPVGVTELEITILRNGWGYTQLTIETEGDFLFAEKSTVTEDDFLGNTCKLPVYADSSCLHAGKNTAAVWIKSPQGILSVPVTVQIGERHRISGKQNREQKKMLLELMELYQSFRLKKVSPSIWQKETTKLIEHMLELEEKNAAIGLFRVQMLLTGARYNEAQECLAQIGSRKEQLSPSLEAYFLYLQALLREDAAYSEKAAEQVMKIYYSQGEPWRVAWLLLFLSDEFDETIAGKWKFLEKQFINGCRSPFIYTEAVLLLNRNPTLLRKLGGFELQVLQYGNKQDVISAELLEQIIYLAGREKEYSALLLTLLKDCYSKKPDSRILQEICTQLIKGNKADRKYFAWFSKGIDEELRITNLYEYYMLSLDIEREPEISKRVLLYYTYQSNLDYRQEAYLYYYVAKNREAFPDLYEIYKKRIERFVTEQVCKRHVNTHLAYLYNAFLQEDMVDETTAEALSCLLFAQEIEIGLDGIRNIILLQPDSCREMIYPAAGEQVWIPLYGEDYVLLLEDLQGQRFLCSIPYSLKKLSFSEALEEKTASLTKNNPALDLYLYEKGRKQEISGEEDLDRDGRILKDPFVFQKVKQEINVKIADYYEKTKKRQLLTDHLESLCTEQMSSAQAGAVVRYMVQNEQYDRAYEWISCFGDDRAEYKILLRLLEVIIEQRAYTYDKELVDFCCRLFQKGSLNSTLLTYLMKYYRGLSKNLGRIWNASKSYSMDKKEFCERFLVQILFSGEQIPAEEEIFKEYVYAGADRKVEDAYLLRTCCRYFTEEGQITEGILTEIGRLQTMEDNVKEICKAAYLKYYAENPSKIQETDVAVIGVFLRELLKEGVRLNCFLSLRQYCAESLCLQDKTIIEYRATKECTVKIRYRILKEEEKEEDAEYQTERMDSVAGRIYYKEFVLFFGESLQYQIMEETDGREKVTKEALCHKDSSREEEESGRYGMISAMAYSRIMKEYDTFDRLTEEYLFKEFLNQTLFGTKQE